MVVSLATALPGALGKKIVRHAFHVTLIRISMELLKGTPQKEQITWQDEEVPCASNMTASHRLPVITTPRACSLLSRHTKFILIS